MIVPPLVDLLPRLHPARFGSEVCRRCAQIRNDERRCPTPRVRRVALKARRRKMTRDPHPKFALHRDLPLKSCALVKSDRLTTNLFSISRAIKNSHNNNAATKTLEKVITLKRCQQEPATKGNSKHAKNATRQITKHKVRNITAEVCYLCAATTIIEEHQSQTPTQDRTRDKEILLHDIRQIAQRINSPSSLDLFFQKKKHPKHHTQETMDLITPYRQINI